MRRVTSIALLPCAVWLMAAGVVHAQCRPDVAASLQTIDPALTAGGDLRELDVDLDGDGQPEHVVGVETGESVVLLVFRCSALRAHYVFTDEHDPSGTLSGAPHHIERMQLEARAGQSWLRVEVERADGTSDFDASRRTFLLLHLSGDALTPAFTCVTHDDFEERDYVSARWQLRRTVLLPTGASRAIRVRRRFAQFDGRRRTSSTGEWVRYTLDGTHFVDAGGAFVCPDDTPERDAAGGADAAGD